MAERKRIFLIRHGTPENTDEEKRYIGVTDRPLSRLGQEEARQLGRCFAQRLSDAPFRIFTSPLERCRSTAMEIYKGLSEQGRTPPTPEVVEALHEINLGAWDGRSVREIRERFPEAYEARGHRLGSYRIAGGESFLEAGCRLQKAVDAIHASTEENLLLVAHAGVIRAYLSLLLERDMNRLLELPMPYASVTELQLCEEESSSPDGEEKRLRCRVEEDAKTLPAENDELKKRRMRVYVQDDDIGVRPEELLDAAEIVRLCQKYETPEQVIRHMRKVAEVVNQLMDGQSPDVLDTQRMEQAGNAEKDLFALQKVLPERSFMGKSENPGALGPLNRARLTKACLLHDLCRTAPQHARVTADVLRKEGYPQIAALVAVHHDAGYTEAEAQEPLTEAELLFYADKRVQEDRIVTVEARFQESRKKCPSPEARAHHAKMLEKTLKIERKIRQLLR